MFNLNPFVLIDRRHETTNYSEFPTMTFVLRAPNPPPHLTGCFLASRDLSHSKLKPVAPFVSRQCVKMTGAAFLLSL